MTAANDSRRGTSITRPALMLGVGLGGFLDGIVLHQLLQWHHLVSARRSPDTVAGLELNTLWDGIFHAAMWLAVAIGAWWAWHTARAGPGSGWQELVGWAMVGWG